MATTMAAPVNNSISLATKYVPFLDEIYKRESLSSVLDTANERVNWVGAQTAKIYKVDLDGLGDYSRNAGFVPGSTDGTWETLTVEKDRGRSFSVDVMDNDETMGMALSSTLGQFERTMVVPEIDSYRFSKYAAGAGTTVTGTLSGSDNIPSLIQTAEATLDNREVPYEGRILFVNPTIYGYLKEDITRYVMNEVRDVNTEVEMYDGMRIIRVPAGRFNTVTTLAAPTDASSTGGYTAAGVDINFMIVHPSAVLQVIKHQIPRVFSPEVNQEADAWKINYRVYHDCWVLANKTYGIYLHKKASASTGA